MLQLKQAMRQAGTLSATVVPMLISVALATGGAIAGLGDGASEAYAANPCAAANPCGPCGAGGQARSTKCVVPRLAAAAKANPCAATSNPCNPCAAKQAANPCNPCAAEKVANPCSPCAATSNPRNPCGAATKVALTAEEAIAAYKCMLPEMSAAYEKSGEAEAKAYHAWARYSVGPYVSDTHGGRFVNNYANDVGKAYGKFEKAGKLPVGTKLAKDSFLVGQNGGLSVGPLFMMEKMKAGFDAASGDWRYTMIGPDGTLIGQTKGKGAKSVQFCAECHAGVGETQDHLFFMPEGVRKKP